MKKTLLIAVFAISAVLYAFIFLCFSMPVISLVKEFIPERKKEIDFTLKYSINGEVITISDTAVCEFDEYDINIFSTASVVNKKYTIYIPSKETKEDADAHLSFNLLDLSDVETTDLFGHNATRIYYYAGNANFYMDIGWGDNPPHDPNGVDVSYIDDYGHSQSQIIYNDRAEELFGVRMISFDYEIRKK